MDYAMWKFIYFFSLPVAYYLQEINWGLGDTQDTVNEEKWEEHLKGQHPFLTRPLRDVSSF